MKNLKFLLIIPILFFSCGDDSTEFESISTPYVSFIGSSASFSESTAIADQTGNAIVVGGSIEITISRSTADLSKALTVDLSIEGVYADSTDFQEKGDDAVAGFSSSIASSLVIPVEASVASIRIQAIDDLFSSGDKVITLTITGTSDSSIELGNKIGGKSVTFIATIQDDDCPITIADWVGTYTVAETFATGLTLATAVGETYDEVTLTLDPTDATGTKMLVNNSGVNVFIGPSLCRVECDVLTFETCSKEVSFASVNPLLGEFLLYFITSSSYSKDDFSISFEGRVERLTSQGTYSVKLTKQ